MSSIVGRLTSESRSLDPFATFAELYISSSTTMADHKNDPNIAYHSVSSEMDSSDSIPKIELGNHPQLSQKRGIITTFVVQIFSLLWLVPVGVLLWLNFSGFVIGATAW